MLKSCIFVTFLFISVWNAVDAQEEFIKNLTSRFPAYVQENGLDPSFIYTEPIVVRSPYWNIVAEFTNLQLFGHSRANSSGSFVRFGIPTESNLGNLSLYVDFGNPNTTIEGLYKVNGTMEENIIISGEGRWSISPKSAFSVIFTYYKVPLSQDGTHMDLKNAGEKYAYQINQTLYDLECKMEGMSAGGNEEKVTGYLMQPLMTSFGLNAELPAPKQIMQYFEDEFEKTPISDMAGGLMF